MQQQLFFFSSSTLSSFTPHFHIPYRNLLACRSERPVFVRKSAQFICCSSHNIKGNCEKNNVLNNEKDSRRRLLMGILSSSYFFPSLSSSANTKGRNPYDEMRLLEQNRRRQRENNVPEDFPSFIREGFQVKVLTSDKYVKRDSGLIYWDLEVGKGDCPRDGQQVTFHYVGYNESGRRIDSTYLQNSPAKIRMGTNSLVPGFEEGIRDMKPGGREE